VGCHDIAKRRDRQARILTTERGPADAVAREEIENDGEVKPALVSTDLPDVDSPNGRLRAGGWRFRSRRLGAAGRPWFLVEVERNRLAARPASSPAT
jgi:hypothetical protein